MKAMNRGGQTRRRAARLFGRGMVAALLGALAWASAGAARADGYPNRPVKLVVPSTPGVAPDILTRIVAQKLGSIWGVPVVVENRPGAAQVVGANYVAKSEPDGYTILFGDSGMWAISPHIYKNLPYDPLKDLAPVIQAAYLPIYLTVDSSFPAHDLKELIAYAKAHPGKVAYSTPGTGSSGHLAAGMVASMAGIDLLHVPYKGSEGVAALLSGNVQLAFYGLVAIQSQMEAGRFRVLATTTPRRSKVLPDIPTVAEAGLPGYDMSPTFGAFVPAGTPPAIVARINEAIAQALKDPQVQAKYESFGTLPVPDATPGNFAQAVRKEYDAYGKLIRRMGVSMQ